MENHREPEGPASSFLATHPLWKGNDGGGEWQVTDMTQEGCLGEARNRAAVTSWRRGVERMGLRWRKEEFSLLSPGAHAPDGSAIGMGISHLPSPSDMHPGRQISISYTHSATFVACLSGKCNIRREVWIFTINFSSENRWGGGEAHYSLFLTSVEGCDIPESKKKQDLIILKQDSQPGMRRRGADSALTQEAKCGQRPLQGGTRSATRLPSVCEDLSEESGWIPDVASAAPSHVSGDSWVTGSGNTDTGVHWCCRPRKTGRGTVLAPIRGASEKPISQPVTSPGFAGIRSLVPRTQLWMKY